MEEIKIERLKKVMLSIESYARHEKQFEKLIELINDEYRVEVGFCEEGRYQKKLDLTKQNQVEDYLDAAKSRPKKGAPIE